MAQLSSVEVFSAQQDRFKVKLIHLHELEMRKVTIRVRKIDFIVEQMSHQVLFRHFILGIRLLK